MTGWAQVTRNGLTPVKKVAGMFARHLPSLLNYLKHHITNARGFACFENFRTRVLFFLGKLNLSQA